MKRVMVVGCCGAGKSTLSKKLSEVTEIDLFHLDQYYWKPNWEETPKNEWELVVNDLANKESWIIDGNYGGTMDARIKKADAIIYLDYPTWKCLWRITKRIWRYHGKVRPDMPKGCRERFSLEFYHYVATYNLLRKKQYHRKFSALADEKAIIILKNDRQVSAYLNQLANTKL